MLTAFSLLRGLRYDDGDFKFLTESRNDIEVPLSNIEELRTINN